MMNVVTKSILELLHCHDCVILPGFGGFITQTFDGKFDPLTRKFYPPCREVSFNGLLTGDDGLLVSEISKRKGVDYIEGKKIVHEYVTSLKSDAKYSQEILIDDIGKFSLSNEGKWIFNPIQETNLLDSSFGLTTVTAPPLITKKTKQKERSIKNRVDRKPHVERNRIPAPVKWTLIISIPIILFLLWGIIFPGSFQYQYASYNNLLAELRQSNKSFAFGPVTSESGELIVNRIQPLVLSEIEYTQSPEDPVKPMETIAVYLDFESNDPPEPPSSQSRKIYYVIGGVFRNENNATRYRSALIALGYKAELAGTNRQGFYRVSYDSFLSWSQAASFLEEIKANENPSAWILK
jgi:nucleoid DNA-binding protein